VAGGIALSHFATGPPVRATSSAVEPCNYVAARKHL